MHFEQSIDLGGYGINAIQYSYFLEDIDQKEQAIDILYKALNHLPEKEIEHRAAVWRRLGKLLSSSHKEEALKAFTEAVSIYEQLFNRDRDSYEFEMADVLMECGSLYIQQSSLTKARAFLERALIIVGTIEKCADTKMQQLSYIILMALGSLHQQLGNNDQTASYQKLALYMGAVISLDNPDDQSFALLEAVRRFRLLLGEKKEGPHSEMIYNYALHHFVKINKWQSQENAFNIAKALNKLGFYLLAEHEVTGAGVCFRGALKIFRILNKKGYPCLVGIADSLRSLGLIYATQNNVKGRKRALLEALNIHKQLIQNEPVENLLKAASVLNELYSNSFIAVPPSQYYKAYPFFEEAWTIYKLLDEKYQKPEFGQWLQLMQHRSVFLSRGLDKTDIISCYQDLIHIRDRIPLSMIKVYEEKIQIALHEMGQLLLENADIGHALYLKIAEDVVSARRVLFKQNPEKYKYYLLWALLDIGNKLADAKQWKLACPYLEDATKMIRDLIEVEPDKYHKDIISPAFKLAIGYSMLKDHERSIGVLTDLCNYFECRISENAEYLIILLSLMLFLTEELLADDQKEKAAGYIERAITYLPFIDEPSEQNRLKMSFEKLHLAY